MFTYRICRRRFTALDGEGARRYGGRWNAPGTPVIYTSSSAALAALELLVHLDPAEAPSDLVLMTIEVPESIARTRIDPAALPQQWTARATPARCREIGTDWLAAGDSCVLEVPAAPMPEEFNVLLNPAHPDFARVRVVAERPFEFDPRL